MTDITPACYLLQHIYLEGPHAAMKWMTFRDADSIDRLLDLAMSPAYPFSHKAWRIVGGGRLWARDWSPKGEWGYLTFADGEVLRTFRQLTAGKVDYLNVVEAL